MHIIQCGNLLYRGPQPRAAEWRQLTGLGIQTVVNLRVEDHSEETTVRQMGMVPVLIPVVDGETPEVSQVWQFIRLVEAATAPVYVHCRGGVGRTGIMVSCFRIVQGSSLAQALKRNSQELLDTGSDLTAGQELFVREFAASLAG